MTKDRIRINKYAKKNIWLHKEKTGLPTMADALDDYIREMKKNERRQRQ